MFETVAIVGLGYVGLPLAIAFGRQQRTIGFDLDEKRLTRYRQGDDPNGGISKAEFAQANQLTFSSDPASLADADAILVAVPTPIDEAHRPDLTPLQHACRTVGAHLRSGATVIFESTVFPGCTEEVCVPLLVEASGMPWLGAPGEDATEGFYVGYSPERINPGDKKNRLETVVKVVAGDTPETLERVATFYESVVSAGVHRAASIKVGEAAKVIENTQRDLNIALMNELSLIFNRLGYRHSGRAGSRWNKVELPAVSAGIGGRPLHWRRSVLPYLQGAGGGPPPSGDSRRASNQ